MFNSLNNIVSQCVSDKIKLQRAHNIISFTSQYMKLTAHRTVSGSINRTLYDIFLD
jgi:hypothetical protein